MAEKDLEELDIVENDDGCKACGKKKTACISFFAHENAMMHKDLENERSHRTNLFMCITFIVITLIFVFAYTVRMNSFIDLIREMNAVIIKLAVGQGILPP